MQPTIQSLDLTIEKLFVDFYVIPAYQREYVWQEKQVEQFLRDIYSEFPPSNFEDKADDYFIGSIVVCPDSDNTDNLYAVIDGQQRITTAYILSCVVKNYIDNLDEHQSIDNIKKNILGVDTDTKGFSINRYKVKLQYGDSSEILDIFSKDEIDLDSIDLKEKSESVKNLVNTYLTIEKFIKAEFQQNESEIRRFYLHFIKRVKLVRVKTIDVNHALRVFETINDRGIGLNPMDLLKNLLFKKAKLEDYKLLSSDWKEIVDLLESIQEKPFSFLRHFIFSQYNTKRDDVQKKEYEWLVENEYVCGYQHNPRKFVEEIKVAAKAYASFLNGKNTDDSRNRYLDNIKHLTPSFRQHMSLLLAAKDLSKECFTELCRHLENFLFSYLITNRKTNELERDFIKWASKLRNVKELEDLNIFIIENINPIKKDLINDFKNVFGELKQSDIQKSKLKYILAKLSQYIDEQALGEEEPWNDLKTYLKTSIEIEHIFPQDPPDNVIQQFDKPDEIKKYIPRLGNLTLLEKSINASINNSLFSSKKNGYCQSKFYLTKSLVEQIKVGTNTQIDKAVLDLKPFDKWNSKAIENRQEILTNLAKKVWDMETLEDASAHAPH